MAKALLRAAVAGVALAAALAGGSGAWAQDAAAPQPDAAISSGGSSLFGDAPIDEVALGSIAGREGTSMVATARNDATIRDNSVGDHSITGDIAVGDNAFQNMSGVSMVNMNSGNNSAINAAINLNLSLTPAP